MRKGAFMAAFYAMGHGIVQLTSVDKLEWESVLEGIARV